MLLHQEKSQYFRPDQAGACRYFAVFPENLSGQITPNPSSSGGSRFGLRDLNRKNADLPPVTEY
jgi:hypothetical protein